MELKSILLVENDQKMALAMQDEFKKHNVKISIARNDLELEEMMEKNIFQMVVLDWYLDETNTSAISRLCLEKIRRKFFLPVIVYTDEVDSFTGEADDVYLSFPKAMVDSCSKDDVNHEKLLSFLQTQHAAAPLSLAESLRQVLAYSTEKALYLLAEQSLNDLTLGLKKLIATDTASQVDVEHAVHVLSRLVEREIFKNDEFMANVQTIIRELSLDNPPNPREAPGILSNIQDLYMFYHPSTNDSIVRTGDLVEIVINSEPNAHALTAIVITPACDLANPRKTMHLRLALIEDVIANERIRESEWDFKDGGKKFKVCFHKLIILENKTLNLNQALRAVMSYAHEYVMLNNYEVKKFKRVKRMEEPYMSDLLHKFVSHAGRIGQPDFSAATLV